MTLIQKALRLVEYSPEKAGVGGSIPSLATILFSTLAIPFAFSQYGLQPTITVGRRLHRPRARGFCLQERSF